MARKVGRKVFGTMSSHRFHRELVKRCLLVGAIIFAVMSLLEMFVVPHCSVLREQPFAAMLVGAVALAAWWVAFRVWKR